MIQYLTYEEIDRKAWDRCIDESYNGLIYGYSWYLDEVCEDWTALVLDDYEAVFPLVFAKKWVFYRLYQPYFTQQLGVFSKKRITPELMESFFKAIPKRFRYINIYLNSFNKPETLRAKLSRRVTHHLSLIEDYTQISKGYSTNHKRNIKKGKKAKLSVVNNINPLDVINLFKEHQGPQVPELKKVHYIAYNHLVHQSLLHAQTYVLGAYSEQNTLVAGAIFMIKNGRAIYSMGASSKEGKEAGAMHFLIDHFIKLHVQSDLVLDFEGSQIPSLARFFKGFGGKEVYYHHIVKTQII